ncbi:MAG: putative molybdenum carrier protein [Desulfobulbaceae bacterium]|nr:putative molybdenum carrier protein [Desulfobulbaceae bacterium]
MVKKIVSGGQTGADQAALDVAIRRHIQHGGWIPQGRLTEEGPLSVKYLLREMPTRSYPKRTEKNVINSEGTLIISHGKLTGGSDLTREMAKKHLRPWLHLDLETMSQADAARRVNSWLKEYEIEVLNVAGARASNDPKIYKATSELLETALDTFHAG